ncbi:unnamed protein product [Adineta steineri]|uniref:Uncharacterized protein n=1 Tax=Adineta steineri TaxID=433720 RepID=A0A816DBV8_9BILA|nr:unnamed protein product [Adineta steineri]CAF1632129.1 unnamed protein product [Adineta steineri]
MIKSYFIFIFISIIIGVSVSVDNDKCAKASLIDCKTCIAVDPGCVYCKNNKRCFAHDIISTEWPCKAKDLQIKTCFADAQTLLIIFGSVGGVVLIAIIVIIVCLCKRCKRRAIRKEEKREGVYSQRLGDRRAQAEVRSAERNVVADNLRMKYGLLKAKDDGADYKRMS